MESLCYALSWDHDKGTLLKLSIHWELRMNMELSSELSENHWSSLREMESAISILL